jgi:hypothetical protein
MGRLLAISPYVRPQTQVGALRPRKFVGTWAQPAGRPWCYAEQLRFSLPLGRNPLTGCLNKYLDKFVVSGWWPGDAVCH